MSRGGRRVSDNKVVTLRGLVRKNSRAMALSGLLLSIYHVAEAMIAVLLGWLAHSLIASENGTWWVESQP